MQHLIDEARQEAAARSIYYEERQTIGRLPPSPDQYVGPNRRTDAARHARILDAITSAGGSIGSNDMHRIIGGSYSTLRADLREMGRQGVVQRHGGHKGGKWVARTAVQA